jgi:surfactin synthase thioesterase subunit
MSRWLVRSRLRQRPRLHLVCFPSAGAGPAQYARWADELPEAVQVWAVQAPGREARVREPAIGALTAIVDELMSPLEPLFDLPVLFFGHSMGSVVAYEVARRRAAGDAAMPRHLFVSAHRPPSLPSPRPPMRHLDDAALLSKTGQRYGGIPAAVLAEPELLALLLPTLRADLTALETHAWSPGAPLDCPITAFGGLDDESTPPDHLEAWRCLTRGEFTQRRFPGGHFYIADQRAAVLAAVQGAIRPHLAAVEGIPG